MEIIPDVGKMGYDRAIVTFSPDGRLFQVEYAREVVKRGTTCIAITYNEGVVMAAAKHEDKLFAKNDQNDKIQQVDDHIAIVSSGLLGDARVLVEQARIKAQRHRITYDEPIDTPSLAKYIADIKQTHTKYGGLRPMGVSFLIGGVNDRPYLFETDPGGSVFEWNAHVIGRGSDVVKKILEKEWKWGMTRDKAVALAIKALKKGEKGLKDNFEVAIIDKKGIKKYDDKEKLNLLKKY